MSHAIPLEEKSALVGGEIRRWARTEWIRLRIAVRSLTRAVRRAASERLCSTAGLGCQTLGRKSQRRS